MVKNIHVLYFCRVTLGLFCNLLMILVRNLVEEVIDEGNRSKFKGGFWMCFAGGVIVTFCFGKVIFVDYWRHVLAFCFLIELPSFLLLYLIIGVESPCTIFEK